MIYDPFASQFPEQSSEAPGCETLSLYELNATIRATLQHTMSGIYRVIAEISELRVASNGHCYLELVQKESGGHSIVAKARAMIWRNIYVATSTAFERATGQLLGVGIKVLVEVKVDFHELYGYSLQVVGIDPSYTLGDLAQRRRAIIRQLEEDGVIDLNKELPLPQVIRRVAIISSKTAAGFGDFCNQLEQSSFDFDVKLFPAIMQGDRVEASVIEALNNIAAQAEQWDVVVIIRGGGATTDLHGFDNYLLAANVAQFPLPVFTGIGHERDDTIVDLVAHTRFKTPTAVAAYLIERRQGEADRLAALQQRLAEAVNRHLVACNHRIDEVAARIQLSATRLIAQKHQEYAHLSHRYELAATRSVSRERERLYRTSARMEMAVLRSLQLAGQQLDVYPQRLRLAVNHLLQQQHTRHEQLVRALRLAGPDRILALGFSITFSNGKPVRNAAELQPGDELVTRMYHGEVKSIVKE